MFGAVSREPLFEPFGIRDGDTAADGPVRSGLQNGPQGFAAFDAAAVLDVQPGGRSYFAQGAEILRRGGFGPVQIDEVEPPDADCYLV